MSSSYVFIALPVAFAFAVPRPCLADEIYKWVDEQGKTHYSQQNPAGASAVKTPIAPHDPNGNPSPDKSMENIKRMAVELEERDKKARAARKKEIEETDKKAALDRENKRRQKEFEDKALADCRRNHNTYCEDNLERVLSEYRKKRGRAGR